MFADPDLVPLLVLGTMWFAVFVFSTTCHEAAHAWTALRGGDPTAFHGGQVSLDPVPHIQREPVGMLLVPWLSYLAMGGGWMLGWASAPYDPYWAMRNPRGAARMAIAGPLANLSLAILAAVALRAGLTFGLFGPPTGPFIDPAHLVTGGSSVTHTLGALLSIAFTLNLVLFLFNLLPVPPLDGYGALPLLVGESASYRYRSFMDQPMMPIAGLIVAWLVFGEIFWPIFKLALRALYAGL